MYTEISFPKVVRGQEMMLQLKKYLSINFLCSNLLCHIETVMNCYVVAKRQQAGIDCGYRQFLVCEQLLDGKFG